MEKRQRQHCCIGPGQIKHAERRGQKVQFGERVVVLRATDDSDCDQHQPQQHSGTQNEAGGQLPQSRRRYSVARAEERHAERDQAQRGQGRDHSREQCRIAAAPPDSEQKVTAVPEHGNGISSDPEEGVFAGGANRDCHFRFRRRRTAWPQWDGRRFRGRRRFRRRQGNRRRVRRREESGGALPGNFVMGEHCVGCRRIRLQKHKNLFRRKRTGDHAVPAQEERFR
ncbi:hypothetical protein SDC9_108731 [bioreactor metagenome]|uniref:Uncharacterized protein n=1 Tax=bioreactor metagenome TaxID=1076179 RepID=A0A645BA09_9ZZZZ